MLAVYFALLFAGIYYFATRHDDPALLVYSVVLTIVLVAIMIVTGERPVRWRWGGK